MKTIPFILLFTALFILTGCQNQAPCPPRAEAIPETGQEHLVADTIIYDVIIRSTNPYDNWSVESLKGLKHQRLIDSLFSLVYDKQVVAYDYFDGTPLSVKQVKKMEHEEGFSREHIGKLQFAEKWYFNKAGQEFHKEVLSVALGHELYSDSGEFRGYKPIFKLQLLSLQK